MRSIEPESITTDLCLTKIARGTTQTERFRGMDSGPIASRCPGMTVDGWRELRAHRLDIVAVGIDQERGVIGRAVVGARARAAVVASAGLQPVAVEFCDRPMIGRPKRDV